ncbi:MULTISPECIES: LytTR family DNA-binding domain-containing protein [Henriciella]|uniref:HTH LytTR-type domain-containing protein n=1 Tax=Henriciella pelagia TaxID=1977912 RepID=A0ABQ1JQW0_9PROT|nr:LytTR family DNA-binding domain-containing protein [Henriciella pelagia]GGB72486.1 hypothetical protein GCM10011503_21440 [Henriciella pelagia]
MRIAIDWKKRARETLILTGIALFLAFLRPFGTDTDTPLYIIFGFWLLLILAGALVGELSVWAFYRLWPEGPTWAMIAIVSMVTAVAVTLLLLGLDAGLGDTVSVGGGPVHILYLYVLVISVAMTLLGYTLSRAFNMAGPDFVHETDDRSAVDVFLERLPVKYRTADLYAVSSEDHYCRVVTSLGSELILMRLSDAERELASVDGLRVHRSWWVSRKGIAESRREGGKIVLTLKSGDEVPVSRSYQDAVKDAGLVH